MAERTPPTVAVKQAWIVGHPFRATTTVEGREAEFDRWLDEVRREVAEKAWDEVADYLDRTNAPDIAEAARRDNPHRKDQP